jgi:Holliday junction resolvase RusA-like endonuclease
MSTFFVPGISVPKGSTKAFYSKKSQKIITMQDNRERQRPWASLISYTAEQEGYKPTDKAVAVYLQFAFPRPKAHYRANGELKPNAPKHHLHTPDLDKLIRGVLDPLTGIVYQDDRQVVEISSLKCYAQDQKDVGVSIYIEERY